MYNNSKTATGQYSSNAEISVGSSQSAPSVADSLERAEKCLSEVNARMGMLMSRIHGPSPTAQPMGEKVTESLRNQAANVADLAEVSLSLIDKISGGITGQ